MKELSELAERMRRNHERLQQKAASLDETVCSIEKKALDLSVCGVDGGLFYHRMHGVDIIASRAVGVNFIYENSRIKSFGYYPSRMVEPVLELEEGLDEHEANVFRSLVRLKSELSCAVAMIEKHSPDLMLMDGSLWLLPSDRPGQGSILSKSYAEVAALYKKLYGLCDGTKTLLCGIIKDSRSCKKASAAGLACSDAILCDFLLKTGEATSVFPYFDEKQKEPEGFWNRLKVFYLKPSDFDLPLRIEYLQSSHEFPEVASLVLSLSSISKSFAYPAVLVEADMRAAMDQREIENIQNQLSAVDLRPLRRHSRPFR